PRPGKHQGLAAVKPEARQALLRAVREAGAELRAAPAHPAAPFPPLSPQNKKKPAGSSSEHHLTDHKGIHEKICSLLVPIRTPVAVFGSEEERVERDRVLRQRRLHVLELSKTEAHKKLYEGQFDLAIPAALQALRFSMDVYDQARNWP
ncbi:MAG: hypothetical protein BJ554DRAFT_6271, partial [Olpidium bornovanus]